MAIISFWLKIKFGLIIPHHPHPASTAGRWFPTEDLPRQQASKQTSCWPPASHAGSQPPAYLSEFSHFRMFLYVIIIYAYYPSRRSFIITAHPPLSSLLITFSVLSEFSCHNHICHARSEPPAYLSGFSDLSVFLKGASPTWRFQICLNFQIFLEDFLLWRQRSKKSYLLLISVYSLSD